MDCRLVGTRRHRFFVRFRLVLVRRARVPSVRAPHRRDGQGAGADASFALIRALFEADEGEREPIVAATAGGWGVAVLTEVNDSGRGATGDERDRLRDQLTRAWRGDLTEAYRAALYGRHEISVNEGTLSALFSQRN